MSPDQIFQQIAQGVDLTAILPLATTPSLDYYHYMKAYKLVNPDKFYAYCRQHKGDPLLPTTQQTDFCQMLFLILAENYPPLEYNHLESDGYPTLSAFVTIARKYL